MAGYASVCPLQVLISTLKVSITNLTFRVRGRLTDTVLLKLLMSKHKHQAKMKILAQNKH
jgi:hypothetical protein